jgi:hypothetical protein
LLSCKPCLHISEGEGGFYGENCSGEVCLSGFDNAYGKTGEYKYMFSKTIASLTMFCLDFGKGDDKLGNRVKL